MVSAFSDTVGETRYFTICPNVRWIINFFLPDIFQLKFSLLHSSSLCAEKRSFVTGILKFFLPRILCVCVFYYSCCTRFFRRDKRVSHDNETVSFKVGVCQPYLKDKWIASEAKKQKDSLIRQTKLISLLEPDVIVWPEASTPYAVNKDRGWVENLVNEINIPLLIGAVIKKRNW